MEKVSIEAEETQLTIETTPAKIIKNHYTENLQNLYIREKIIIDPAENILEKHPGTIREYKNLFHAGFLKYKY